MEPLPRSLYRVFLAGVPLTLLLGIVVGCGVRAPVAAPGLEPAAAPNEGPLPDEHVGSNAGDTSGQASSITTSAEPNPVAAEHPPTTLAEWLNHAGVTAISQVDVTFLDGRSDEQHVQALAYADAEGAHVCVALAEDSPTCWNLGFQPTRVTAPTVTLDVEVRISFGYAVDSYVSVSVADDNLTAALGYTDERPTQPLAGVSLGEVPPFFDALSGYELATSGPALVARLGSTLRLCQRPEVGPYTCSEPTQVDELDAERFRITSLQTDFDGVIGIEFVWEEQMGDVYWQAQGVLFLRATATTVTLLASVYTAYERTSRVSVDNDDIEVLSMEMDNVEQRRADCLHIGTPTLARHMRRARGGTRTMRPPRLQRAPDSVPATGVDPLAVNITGAWAMEPEGGLRRIPRCEYEDD